MSHFTVAVITNKKPCEDDIYRILAPYRENNMGTVEKQYLEFHPIDQDELSDFKQDFDECEEKTSFRDYMENECGYSYNEETKEYGTYDNPNARFDWMQIGGRWTGLLMVKKGADYGIGEPSWGADDSVYHSDIKDIIKCDIARIKDLVFLNKEKEKQDSQRFWELHVEKQPVEDKNDEKLLSDVMLYKPEYYINTYHDKETFVRCCATFTTHAVITKDGQWLEEGAMGWFGCRDESNIIDWTDNYHNLVFENASDDDYITIVDCHI